MDVGGAGTRISLFHISITPNLVLGSGPSRVEMPFVKRANGYLGRYCQYGIPASIIDLRPQSLSTTIIKQAPSQSAPTISTRLPHKPARKELKIPIDHNTNKTNSRGWKGGRLLGRTSCEHYLSSAPTVASTLCLRWSTFRAGALVLLFAPLPCSRRLLRSS